jgi:hypothetical protein
MAEQPIPKYPIKTLVKFICGQDEYIGQILKSEIVKPGQLGRKPGSVLYMLQILSINRKKLEDYRVTTIGEDEIIASKLPE